MRQCRENPGIAASLAAFAGSYPLSKPARSRRFHEPHNEPSLAVYLLDKANGIVISSVYLTRVRFFT
jgi:hypothetical protein